jgi:hypothetical protein
MARIFLAVLVLSGMSAIAADEMAANETAAAAACMALAEANEIYRRTDYDQDGILEYAQALCGRSFTVGKPLDPATLPKPSEDEKARIAAKIKAMSDNEYTVREGAATELKAFESKAYEQLKAAAKEEKDPEIVNRCKNLIVDIERKLAPAPTVDVKCNLLELTPGAGDLALIDMKFAEAECFPGADPSKIKPKAGYLFRALTRQGPDATGGKRDYIVKGNMTLGYAFLAFPKEYGVTGKKCFIINNNGTIYGRDFGDKAATEAFAKDCVEFNPDKSWRAEN